MRLLVLSDLHLDIWRGHHPKTDLDICKPDVVILAGDIHGGTKAVKWAEAAFMGLPVLYVHGNHEGYGYNLESVQRKIANECAESHNVSFLNADEVIINGVRFLGCTMWTDFRLYGDANCFGAMCSAEEYMNDYHAIRLEKTGYKKLRAVDTAEFHRTHRAWLDDKLGEPFEGETVVITHMAPSMKSVPDQYKSDIVSAAYASHLDELAQVADLWIHGHTHTSFDYMTGDCRVVCNPCGYPYAGGNPENIAFNPNLIIEI